MSKRWSMTWLIPAVLAAGMAFAQNDSGPRSLAEIEAELDPLEFIDNHGGIRRSIDLDIAFDFDSDQLLPAGQEQIRILGQAMQGERLKPYSFLIVGHTDAVGSAEYNLQLSERRANTVRQVLIEDYGIDPDRLLAEGRGENQLIDGYPEDAATHRRVEIVAEPGETDADSLEAKEEATKGEIPIDW